MNQPPEPRLDLVDGDIGMSRHLGKALKILADSPIAGPDLQAQIRDILAGKATLRDLAQSESFQHLGDAVLRKAEADHAERSPEEVQQLAEQGEALLAAYREEPPEPSTMQSPEEPEAPPSPMNVAVPRPDGLWPGAVSHGLDRVPGTRESNRDMVVGPSDDLDEDDQYFQDRRHRGWLE